MGLEKIYLIVYFGKTRTRICKLDRLIMFKDDHPKESVSTSTCLHILHTRTRPVRRIEIRLKIGYIAVDTMLQIFGRTHMIRHEN